ncbi:MAG: hypothetical protein FD126_3108, partial [Elusimicrobia bacterium]
VSLGAMAVQGGAAAGAGSLESASAGAGAAFEGFSAPPTPVRAEDGGEPRPMNLSLAADRPSHAGVPVPAAPARKTAGIGGGAVKGTQEGAMAGFSVVLQPAVSLISKSYNGGGGWYMAAGVAVGAILYIPALVAAGLGGLGGSAAGGVAEAVAPGSTDSWCGECVVD